MQPCKQPEGQIYRLNTLGLIKIGGKDAHQLLQGQLTCHIDLLKPGSASLSAHCNPQGRMISLFYICLHQTSFYLFMPKSLIPIGINALKKYAVFYQVEMTDLSTKLATLGLVHPKLHLVQDQIISFNIPDPSKDDHLLHQVFFGEAHAIESLSEELKEQGNVNFANENDWKFKNIMAGIPEIYPDTSEKWLPHEINLPKLRGVDFNKGCYTGQEIIARMHYRGKLKREMSIACIESQSPIKPGADIYSLSDHKIIPSGIIVDSILHKDNQSYALIITDKNNAKDNHLFLEQHQGYFNFLKRS